MAITKHIITNCIESVSATAQNPPVKVYINAIPPRTNMPITGFRPSITLANIPKPYKERAGRE